MVGWKSYCFWQCYCWEDQGTVNSIEQNDRILDIQVEGDVSLTDEQTQQLDEWNMVLDENGY